MKHLVGVIVDYNTKYSEDVDILGFKLADAVGNISDVSLADANKLLNNREIFCGNCSLLASMLKGYCEHESKWALSLRHNKFIMNNRDRCERSSNTSYPVLGTNNKLLLDAKGKLIFDGSILILYYNTVTHIAIAYYAYTDSIIYLLALEEIKSSGICEFMYLSDPSKLVIFEYHYLYAGTLLYDDVSKITDNVGMFDKLLNLYTLCEKSSTVDLIVLPSDCKFLNIGLLHLSDGLTIVFNPKIDRIFVRDGVEITGNSYRFKVNFNFSSKTSQDIVNDVVYEIRKSIVDKYGIKASLIDFCIDFY